MPCLICEDLVSVIIHEVGHVLGLSHPDIEWMGQQCGCGNASVACNRTHRGTVMQSTITSNVCLTRTMWTDFELSTLGLELR